MLLGLLHPTKGKTVVLDGDATESQISQKIGFLPEESYLYGYLTARETLDFYGRLFKLPARVRKLRIEALLDMVGLKAVANRPIGTFSKGMARRIGLAQALINDPDLLILDEPTTGLDPIGTRQFKDLIIELAKRGKTILLCSHLLADVEDVCDRIAILYGGKVRVEGNVRELLQHSDKTEIITDRLEPTVLEKIKQLLADERVKCTIGSPVDKLETFFINVVAAAQQQAVATSGAQSRTGISDFLAAKPDEESRRAAILDQLVLDGMSAEQISAFQTQKVQPASPAKRGEPKPAPVPSTDENLLRRLTEEDGLPQLKSVVTQPQKTEPSPSQPDKNILDELAGHESPDKKQKLGDSPDA
jgi:ABC-2 type transport system ATP-binding protein